MSRGPPTNVKMGELTSNPIRAIILARDAPGSMSQEPGVRTSEWTVRMAHLPVKLVLHTDDVFLRLFGIVEEFMESKLTRRHSGGDTDKEPTRS